jgi:hypothetical protein
LTGSKQSPGRASNPRSGIPDEMVVGIRNGAEPGPVGASLHDQAVERSVLRALSDNRSKEVAVSHRISAPYERMAGNNRRPFKSDSSRLPDQISIQTAYRFDPKTDRSRPATADHDRMDFLVFLENFGRGEWI